MPIFLRVEDDVGEFIVGPFASNEDAQAYFEWIKHDAENSYTLVSNSAAISETPPAEGEFYLTPDLDVSWFRT